MKVFIAIIGLILPISTFAMRPVLMQPADENCTPSMIVTYAGRSWCRRSSKEIRQYIFENDGVPTLAEQKRQHRLDSRLRANMVTRTIVNRRIKQQEVQGFNRYSLVIERVRPVRQDQRSYWNVRDRDTVFRYSTLQGYQPSR